MIIQMIVIMTMVMTSLVIIVMRNITPMNRIIMMKIMVMNRMVMKRLSFKALFTMKLAKYLQSSIKRQRTLPDILLRGFYSKHYFCPYNKYSRKQAYSPVISAVSLVKPLTNLVL